MFPSFKKNTKYKFSLLVSENSVRNVCNNMLCIFTVSHTVYICYDYWKKKMKKMNNEYKINKEKEQNNHMKNFAFLMLFFVECFCVIEKKVFIV